MQQLYSAHARQKYTTVQQKAQSETRTVGVNWSSHFSHKILLTKGSDCTEVPTHFYRASAH